MSVNTAAAPTDSQSAGWRLDHSYLRLPESLHQRVSPALFREPRLVILNHPLARNLGLDPEILDRPEHAGIFTGNVLPPGAEPLAQFYAGHQYGNFTFLGDGRAILLGEQLAPDGRRFDVQLKGQGPTPFSRRGDGRAALGPMLREYLISEAMHALGIPTTRSLAVAVTGEVVMREQPLPGAVLTRIAASHIRVGTFEGAAARGDLEALKALADHTLARHYPELEGTPEPHLALLQAVTERQAALVARWQLVGFVHGVMNTDNMALSGETIDYGPCAFMDAYDPATVFSSIDRHGRYAYGNQPRITQWNLTRLAEAMLPLLHAEEARAVELANGVLGSFADAYRRHWLAGMRLKLGLFTEEPDDFAMAESLLEAMHSAQADFTVTFRTLARALDADPAGLPSNGAWSDPGLQTWLSRWRERLSRQPQAAAEVRSHLLRHNPAVIPRNHRVEEALEAATRNADLGPLHKFLKVLQNPFDALWDGSDYSSPPPEHDRCYRTFCGT
jgi:uncharacterized protein YdiU (UPF0061 family)